MSSEPAIGIDATKAVSPLDRREQAERGGGFNREPEPGVVPKSFSKPGIMNRRRVEEAVDPHESRCRPGSRRPGDRTSIVADKGGWIAMEPVVERSKRVPAESVQIGSADDLPLDPGDQARCDGGRAGHRDTEPLVVAVRLGVLVP